MKIKQYIIKPESILNGTAEVNIPIGGNVKSVKEFSEYFILFVEVDDKADIQKRSIKIFKNDSEVEGAYIATVRIYLNEKDKSDQVSWYHIYAV